MVCFQILAQIDHSPVSNLVKTAYIHIVLKIVDLHHAPDSILLGAGHKILVSLTVALGDREDRIDDMLRKPTFQQILRRDIRVLDSVMEQRDDALGLGGTTRRDPLSCGRCRGSFQDRR